MPDFLIRALADMSVARSLVIAAGLFIAGACALLLLVDARHLTPRWLRRALPLRLRTAALRFASFADRQRIAVIGWLSAPIGTPTPSSSSAPKKGALR